MAWPSNTRASGYVITAADWNEIATGLKTWGGDSDAAGYLLNNLASLVLKGATSGTTTLQASATASGTLTLPAATDTLVGKATTDTFTNKTLDTAGAGNFFKINGTTISTVTGTGSAVLATSPTIATPTLSTYFISPAWRPAANSTTALQIQNASGTYIVNIDTTNSRVGIGTNAPTSPLEVNGVIKDSKGDVRSIPQNSQTTAYTLVAADAGKHISTTAGVTVPASVFSIGDAITLYNNSASSITITQGASATLRQVGTANTGNRTLAQRGLATIVCVASNEFVISGGGLT